MSKDSNIPGWDKNPFTSSLAGGMAGGMASGMDFMKNFWGKTPSAMPGFVVPTVDLAEIEKRIQDLKAVESWLAINANMLRASIQALEVQHSTIATLQALGKSFTSSSEHTHEASNLEARHSAPLNKHGLPPGWPETAPLPANEDSTAVTKAPEAAPVEARDALDATIERSANPSPTQPPNTASATPTPANMSTNAWLGFLHDQFSKVAMSALAPEGKKATASSKPVVVTKQAARPKPKTAAKKIVARKTARPAKTSARKA